MKDKQTLVFFDAVGTLIYPDPPIYSVYHTIGQKHGSRLTKDDIAVRFTQAYQLHFSKQNIENLCTSEDLEKQRWLQLVEQVFDDVSMQNSELFSELWEHFSINHHWKVYDDIKPIMEALLNASVYVGVASNFDARIIPICKHLFPDIQTERIYYSTSMGYAKPHAQFYKTIENSFCDTELSFIMVGDDYENDIEAAHNVGWNAIHRDNVAGLLDALTLPS